MAGQKPLFFTVLPSECLTPAIYTSGARSVLFPFLGAWRSQLGRTVAISPHHLMRGNGLRGTEGPGQWTLSLGLSVVLECMVGALTGAGTLIAALEVLLVPVCVLLHLHEL